MSQSYLNAEIGIAGRHAACVQQSKGGKLVPQITQRDLFAVYMSNRVRNTKRRQTLKAAEREGQQFKIHIRTTIWKPGLA